jgi:RNA-directed DNA polymerase
MCRAGPRREGEEPKPAMNGGEKSDGAIVATKLRNEAGEPAEEAVERRAAAEGNTVQGDMHRTQSRARVTQALDRIRQVAKDRKGEQFTALLHHVNQDTLREAFYALDRKAAPGVDGVTWRTFEAELEPRLAALTERVHQGSYVPQPARRVYIPKADGKQRPLAIAALEDKIVQGAVVMVLNAIWEEDFLGFSYGFRPGRGPHDALDALTVAITSCKVNWIVDADIRSFFDTVSQEWLIRFVEHRVGDVRIVRLIRKWLRAGVLEDGIVSVSETGTGQGAVISPLLANIYLHYVLDLWAESWRRREAGGDMIIVRYADDVVVGFESRTDASRFLDAMRARFAEFALLLHPEKTRLIEFGRFAASNREKRGLGKPETFNFLGFTYICGKTRAGKFLVERKTRRDRLRAKLRDVKVELRRRMHRPIPEQGHWLRQVVTGFFNYHAVPTNSRALSGFHHEVIRHWLQTLRRRSQRQTFTWERMIKLASDWLPKPTILHPWPRDRFAVKHPRWEPYAGKPLVRFCAGGAG